MFRWSSLVLLSPLGGFAQSGPIETDRPDQTETPGLVPVGWVQLELGAIRGGGMDENTSDWNLPSGLLKVGINDRFELRIETELTRHKAEDADAVQDYGPLELGLKTALCAEQGWVPRTSFLMHVGVPGTGSGVERAEHASMVFRFLADHSVGERVSVGANAGMEWDGNPHLVTSVYTFTGGVRFSDHFGGYAEVYGSIPENAPAEQRWDGGFTWLPTDNIQVDTSGGHSFGDDAWFVSLGFSARFPAWHAAK